MAPIAPFYADYLYRSLNDITKKEPYSSVHLTDFPLVEQQYLDEVLDRQMRNVQTIVSLAHGLRKKYKIKVRQPLASIRIVENGAINAKHLADLEELIKSEINVKQIHYVDNTHSLVLKKAKPNFAILGKCYGHKIHAVRNAILALTQQEICDLEQGKTINLCVENEPISISLAEVFIVTEDMPGWCVAMEDDVTIALDTTLNTNLKQEGLAREFIHRIQRARKDQGLDIQDKIVLSIQDDNPSLKQAVLAYSDYICMETQAVLLKFITSLSNGQSRDVEGMAGCFVKIYPFTFQWTIHRCRGHGC